MYFEENRVYDYHDYYTPRTKLEDYVKEFNNVIIPEIKNTAALLEDALIALDLQPIPSIVTFTKTDDNPSRDQIKYVINTLYDLLLDVNNCKILNDKSKYAIYLGAWKMSYNNLKSITTQPLDIF